MAKRKLALVTKGNGKLGKDVYHTNLAVGESCPGASEWCSAHCYAKKGNYTFPGVKQKYSSNLALLSDDPASYEAELTLDVLELPIGGLFRFHTGGDVFNIAHVGIIRRVCEARPDVSFWLYTRSWRIPGLRAAIETELFPVGNLTVWGSTDPSLPAVPAGWREARVFDTFEEATEGGFRVHCPEQTGKQPDCQSCGLCFKAKPEATLAFATH